MIRAFQFNDLENFTPNEYSKMGDYTVLTNPAFRVHSQLNAGKVQAIIVFRNYWGRCWSGFVLVSAEYTLHSVREMKRFMYQAMEDMDAVRFQTESVACDILAKFHHWLGFKYEGTKVKMIFDRDYDMWALMRQGV